MGWVLTSSKFHICEPEYDTEFLYLSELVFLSMYVAYRLSDMSGNYALISVEGTLGNPGVPGGPRHAVMHE